MSKLLLTPDTFAQQQMEEWKTAHELSWQEKLMEQTQQRSLQR